MMLLPFLLSFSYIGALPATHIDPMPRPTISNLTSSEGGYYPSGSVATILSTVNSTIGFYQVVNVLDSFAPMIGPSIRVTE